MTNIPETLRQASEALQQASAALTTVAQAMEDAPGPEPAPELEPGEWRNDRAPKECESDDNLRVWVWQFGATWLVDCDLACFWYEKCPARNYWAPGNRPAPKSPPPDVVASQEVEPEKPRGFFPFTPEEFAAACSEPQPEAPPEPNESPVRRWIIDRPPTEEDDWVAIPARPGTDRSGFEIVAWCHAYPGTPWAPVGAIPDEPFDPTCLDRNGWIRSRLPTVEDTGYDIHALIPVGNGGTTATIAYHLIVPGQPWAPWDSNPGGFEK